MTDSSPTEVLLLDGHRRELYEAVCARLDADRFRDLLVDLIGIHSPTGQERAASEFMATHLRDRVGIDARYQPISENTGNAIGELRGSGGGSRLLLYAPIDTHIDPESDVPWVGKDLRPDMLPEASVHGDLVVGLGASNPKCMVAGLTEVMHAVVDAEIPLIGDLAIGFAGGGMPVTMSKRDNVGMSSGVFHLLTHGMAPDHAVVLKPWWAVYPEEPGMCWFKVSVRGTFGYAGISRGTEGFRSSIVPAATVIQAIEEWLPEYTARNTSGSTIPEGWISAVRSGSPDKPAFPSATTEICLDVRVNPRVTPGDVRHQFAQMIDGMCKRHPDLDLDWEMYGSLPGGMTDPNNWIIQSCRRGWEEVEGRPYSTTPLLGGQTDGTLIRRLGIPCARIGYPWPPATTPDELKDGLGGMGVASVSDVMMATKAIAYAVVDTLTRTREDLEL
ncbi:acetylornithine deacetylase [Rhodococcus sp. HNM0563]|uniref:M20 family metallopeptidase n=1 Tax=unclassified Rhodococcus (in: high G+C Gram-positive bacteria) TaxID=192944 RepID=UPI00146E583F|nr:MULTISPECIES: acetylornithine deacetylase [unclassified Rhodococcus (in: high G+C Gram-positive bacteria)]MCK0091519.1 acetylornithine deacetylase [Rhodococcus sp. F64268]NLU63610.1 acetylornithine deacetylase [Rhodococcus sp. HNM0563]